MLFENTVYFGDKWGNTKQAEATEQRTGGLKRPGKQPNSELENESSASEKKVISTEVINTHSNNTLTPSRQCCAAPVVGRFFKPPWLWWRPLPTSAFQTQITFPGLTSKKHLPQKVPAAPHGFNISSLSAINNWEEFQVDEFPRFKFWKASIKEERKPWLRGRAVFDSQSRRCYFMSQSLIAVKEDGNG